MKIAVVLHHMMDLGGIINHTEQLIGGLKDLGHEVTLYDLNWKGPNSMKGFNGDGDWQIGPSGIPHDQGKGWKWHYTNQIGYRTHLGLVNFKMRMSTFDMVIWETPVASRNKENAGNSDWIELYDLPKKIKQVAFIHDGNAIKGYPHIVRMQEFMAGFACVHHCALGSSGFLKTPRALILNPQLKPVREYGDWDFKSPGFVNMQTFKAWKHVHELVEAIAYMPNRQTGELREIAGKGIEYQYMTSEDKCKENYFHGDVDKWFKGWKFWDAAIGNGMEHHGYWNSQQVDEWLIKARVLVDPSWSKNYSKYGGHYNRVVVDAMIRGAIPVARRLGMGTELFKPGENYIEIPEDASPQEYADIVLNAGNMPKRFAEEVINANRDILPLFDRKYVAQQIIDLAHGNLEVVGQSMDDTAIRSAADDVMFNQFGTF